MARTISHISTLPNENSSEKTKLMNLEYELNSVSKLKYNLSILYFIGVAALMVGLFI